MKNYTIKTIFIAFSILLTNNTFCIDIVPLQKDNPEEIAQVQQILETDLPIGYVIHQDENDGLEVAMKYLISPKLMTLVAKDSNNNIVGVINYYLKTTILMTIWEWIAFKLFSLNKVRFINMIIVHQDYRGKGIGKALLEKAFQDFKNNGILTVQLAVSAKNTDAQKFYTKIGFTNLTEDLINNENLSEDVKQYFSQANEYMYMITL